MLLAILRCLAMLGLIQAVRVLPVRSRVLLRMSSVAGAGTTNPLKTNKPDLFSVAPMMEYTDMHQRNLFRLLTKRSILYTEMVTTNALVRNEDDPLRFLQADFGAEMPLVLQLGGSDPVQMREAARIGHKFGYREININCGCPSEKVADAGCFGAALMLNPLLVANLATAVGESTGQPATIKCRIGVNDNDSYEQLCAFVDKVSTRGAVRHFIVHARRAVLGAKFSPDDNRKIPPLKYDYVYRLVEDFPHLQFTLNGGVNSLAECKEVLARSPRLAGVMVGRACVNSVFQWSTIDSQLYGQDDPNLSRRQILEQYAAYADRVEASPGGKRARRAIIKPLLGMFTGEPRGRLFRAKLDEYLLVSDSDTMMQHSGSSASGTNQLPASEVILRAAQCLKDETLDLKPSDWLVAMEARARQQKQIEPGLTMNQNKERGGQSQAQAQMQMQGIQH